MPYSPALAIDAVALMLLRAFKQHDVALGEPALTSHLAADIGVG
jgi:hypothetical protein